MGSCDYAYGDEANAQQLHVLAVDDSLVDRKVIERLLKISSCKVTVVESGSKALQYLGFDGETNSADFKDLKVNLIMTDYSMPGMTGFELLQKIKGSPKLRDIPVVIMSSENILARVNRCLEEGAEDFLFKPVKLSDVERLKNLILRGEEKNKMDDSPKKKMGDDSSLLMAPSPLLMAPTPPLTAPTPPLMAPTPPLIAPSSSLMGPPMSSLMASSSPLMSPSSPLMTPTSPLMAPSSSLMAPPVASPSPLGCDNSLSPMSVSTMAHERQPKCARLVVAAD